MIVYKVTNLINGKIYVSKTAYSLSIRKTQHLSDVKTERRNSALHKAIKKYGNENFTWEIIDRCLFAESLIF